jgi:Zn-finger nucleic acid-binding protein
MNPITLTCPKCGAHMRTYERSGIHVDQCAECRGIYLDRGELERLMDAETAHYAREQQAPAAAVPVLAAPAAAAPRPDPAGPAPQSSRSDPRRDGDWDDDRGDERGDRSGRGRRGGFLGDMFEMFGE